MIQRIQSIYLFLTTLLMGGTFSNLFDIGRVPESTDTGIASMMADGHIDILDNPIWIGLSAAAALLAFVAIFLYNNRKLQLNISKLAVVLIVGAIVAMIVMLLPAIQANIFQPGYDFGLQLLAIVFAGLGIRGINKDNVLVKSMDRLR